MSRVRENSNCTSPSGSISGSEQLDSSEDQQDGFPSCAHLLDSNEAGEEKANTGDTTEDHLVYEINNKVGEEKENSGNSTEVHPVYEISSEGESMNSNDLMLPEIPSRNDSSVAVSDSEDTVQEEKTASQALEGEQNAVAVTGHLQETTVKVKSLLNVNALEFISFNVHAQEFTSSGLSSVNPFGQEQATSVKDVLQSDFISSEAFAPQGYASPAFSEFSDDENTGTLNNHLGTNSELSNGDLGDNLFPNHMGSSSRSNGNHFDVSEMTINDHRCLTQMAEDSCSELDFEQGSSSDDADASEQPTTGPTIINQGHNKTLNISPSPNSCKISSPICEDLSSDGELSSTSTSLKSPAESDLEEGEIKDDEPPETKDSDTASCRFFKLGACLYGAQCHFRHISDAVYGMFKSDVKEVDFDPVRVPDPVCAYVLEPSLSAWEEGLKTAKELVGLAVLKKNTNVDRRRLSGDERRRSSPKRVSEYTNDLRNRLKTKDLDRGKTGWNVSGENDKFLVKQSIKDETRRRSPKRVEKNIDDLRNCLKTKDLDRGKAGWNVGVKNDKVLVERANYQWSDPWRRSRSPIRSRVLRTSSSSPSIHSSSRSISSFEKVHHNSSSKKHTSYKTYTSYKKHDVQRSRTHPRKRCLSRSSQSSSGELMPPRSRKKCSKWDLSSKRCESKRSFNTETRLNSQCSDYVSSTLLHSHYGSEVSSGKTVSYISCASASPVVYDRNNKKSSFNHGKTQHKRKKDSSEEKTSPKKSIRRSKAAPLTKKVKLDVSAVENFLHKKSRNSNTLRKSTDKKYSDSTHVYSKTKVDVVLIENINKNHSSNRLLSKNLPSVILPKKQTNQYFKVKKNKIVPQSIEKGPSLSISKWNAKPSSKTNCRKQASLMADDLLIYSSHRNVSNKVHLVSPATASCFAAKPDISRGKKNTSASVVNDKRCNTHPPAIQKRPTNHLGGPLSSDKFRDQRKTDCSKEKTPPKKSKRDSSVVSSLKTVPIPETITLDTPLVKYDRRNYSQTRSHKVPKVDTSVLKCIDKRFEESTSISGKAKKDIICIEKDNTIYSRRKLQVKSRSAPEKRTSHVCKHQRSRTEPHEIENSTKGKILVTKPNLKSAPKTDLKNRVSLDRNELLVCSSNDSEKINSISNESYVTASDIDVKCDISQQSDPHKLKNKTPLKKDLLMERLRIIEAIIARKKKIA